VTPKAELETYGEAAKFDLDRRAAVPGQAIPIDRYLTAREKAQRLPVLRRISTKRPQLSAGAWEQLGPFNVGGRARTLLIDPRDARVMYTSGAAGGLWKSTDGGDSWRALDDFLPILAIGSLAFDPSNPDILYAGTGDNSLGSFGVRGAGIYKSVNAGESWTRLAATVGYDFRFVRSLAIAREGGAIYAATNKGVLRSTDGGQSWAVTLDRDIPNRGCQQLAMRSDKSEDYVFASCGVPTSRPSGELLNKTEPGEDPNAPAAIFLNRNARATESGWDQVLADPDMGNSSIAIAPSNQDVVYVLASNTGPGNYQNGLLAVYRSETGGGAGSWQVRLRNDDARRVSTMILSNPSNQLCANGGNSANQAWFVNTISVDPLDPERVFAASVDAFRSDDGGASWGQISTWNRRGQTSYAHADHHAIVFHPAYNGLDNQTTYLATDGGIFRSDNALASKASTDAQLCSGGGIGVIWRDANRNLATTQYYHGVVYPGGHVMLGGLQDNGTLRGTAGGADFTPLNGGDGAISAIDSLDANTIYAASQGFGLVRSTDGGATFFSGRGGIADDGFAFIAPMAVDPRDSRRLWAGGKSMWRTVNGAVAWRAASGPIAERSVSAIHVSPHDSNVVFAGTRTGEIFRTNEALTASVSTEWAMSKARTGWVSAIMQDRTNPRIVYAVYSSFNREEGDAHLYKSVDGGGSWRGIDLPDAPYFALTQHPEDPDTLYLAGDLGLFVSTDAGESWAREDELFPAVSTQHLTIERDGLGYTLYAFTYGRGVWRVRLSGGGCSYESGEEPEVTMSAAGGVVSRSLRTSPECVWSVISNANWIRVVSTASGSGDAEVRLLVSANPAGAPSRSASVTIADSKFTVTQTQAGSVDSADDSAQAIEIDGVPYAAVVDTRQATTGIADTIHSCTGNRDSKTVWFRYRAAATRTLLASVTTAGGQGAVVTVYPLIDGLAGAEIACAANSGAISFEAREGQSYLIQLSGMGSNSAGGLLTFSLVPVSSSVDLLPKVLDFGAVEIGRTESRRFLLKNSGNNQIVVSAVSLSEGFALAETPASRFTIAVGGQLEWSVQFTPKAEGAVEGVLRFGSIEVPLRGMGVK
jgi:photosystem II stability/assembly factor-like uncharacterized protein